MSLIRDRQILFVDRISVLKDGNEIGNQIQEQMDWAPIGAAFLTSQ